MAPKVAAVDTWWPHATVRIGLAVPGRPMRSLVAEDRERRTASATGRGRRSSAGAVNLSCAMIPMLD
jgi:hypothetical protein